MSDNVSADIKYYLNNLKDDLTVEETEDSWERITKAMLSFARTCEQGGYEATPVEVINALRNFSRPIVNAMNSERTRLSGAAIDLLVSVATGLGREFEQLLPLFMPTLLALCGRTNKVVLNRARTCIITIIESTQLASVLSYFLQNVKDKSTSLRLIAAEGTLACLNSCNPPDLEKESRARDIEAIIRNTARDANADVRKLSRKIFESYKILLPGRVDSFTAPLTPTMKKYLDIKSNGVSKPQSKSNLRTNLNMKPNTKPLTSTSASTSAVTHNPGHTRTASTPAASTASQICSLAKSLTRVARKDPVTTEPAPHIPVRGKTPTIASRPGSVQEVKGPVRPQACVVSRAPTSAAPHRLPMTSGVIPTPATSAPQSSVPSGPRRVPMPPPPPPPAPVKEKPAVTLKRPTSRADTAPSNQRPAVSAAPAKKPVITIASSLQNRGPATKAKKPTVAASSSSSTKALAINKKPIWGRSAPVPKAAATISQRPASKTSTKKASSQQASASTSGASKTRPTDEIPALQKPESGLDQNNDQRSGDVTPSSRQSPIPTIPTIDGGQVNDEQQELQEQEPEESPISSDTIANPISVKNHSNSPAMPSTDECPTTPQGALLDQENTNTVILPAKTPISALLSSIQHGFLYSPSSPLSPADSYLLPGRHGMTRTGHKDRDGPIHREYGGQPWGFSGQPTPVPVETSTCVQEWGF